MYTVHKCYGSFQHFTLHLVKGPGGRSRVFSSFEDLKTFLMGKNWRLAH